MTLDALLSAALSFAFFALVFRPLELVFPARAQRVLRPGFWTDLAHFLGQYLLWNTLVLAILARWGAWLPKLGPLQWPWWAQAVAVILVSDFCIYWGHRLQHGVPILWRFHSIHHSAEHLDWLAAHREHPVDTLYTMGLINLPAFLLGFPLQTLAGLIAFRGLWAIYIHSNVRLPLGPLRILLGAPELHHWHHDRARDAGNYANLCPLMDWLFGTYRCPDHQPAGYGVRAAVPAGYLGQLRYPFRKES